MVRGSLVACLVSLLGYTGAAWATEQSGNVFPLRQGLYSDGENCGAAEISRNPRWNGFGVDNVIGSECELKKVNHTGDVYRFTASCSEGLGTHAHSWKVASRIHVSGDEAFTFDGRRYQYCGIDHSSRTSNYVPHTDAHLPLVAGDYFAEGEKCGAIHYWDNPKFPTLSGSFGGPATPGDACNVDRVRQSGGTINFATTCIPSQDGKLMTIGAPQSIRAVSHSTFVYNNKMFSLCKMLRYD